MKVEPLGKDNFDTWKIQVEALLIKIESWKYVEGILQKPAEPPAEVERWENNDAKARSDFILAICSSKLKQIKNCTTSKEIWDKLHNVYQSKGPARKATLLKSLILLKLKNGEDMRDHLHSFFDIVDKLQEMELEINDDLLTILLLYSVPDEYESFGIAIETQEKLPSPENLKIKLLEEYEARKRNGGENIQGAMFVKHNQGKPKGNYKNPDKPKEKEKNERFKFPCHTCGKIGHYARDCKSKSYRKNETPEASKMSEESTQAETEDAIKIDTKNEEQWCLDSDASSHMCSQKGKFREIAAAKSQLLNLANNNSTKIEESGVVKLNTREGVTPKLEDTLFVPDLRSNLLSVGKMTQHGFEVIFKKDEAVILDPRTKEKVMTATRKRDLYYVTESTGQAEESTIAQPATSPLQEWHERFGHLNEKDLKNIIRQQKVDGVNIKIEEKLPVCEICIKGKQTQKPYSTSTIRSEETLDLIHTDVCGSMRIVSPTGSRYIVTFINKSKWCEVYFMKKKSAVPEKCKEYKAMVEKNTGRKIKKDRSDNDLEYVRHYLGHFLKKEGMKRKLTVAHTRQQNGVTERTNRTLVEMARCMMLQSGISGGFWAEAILTANHIRNRCPSRSLNGEIPFKIWTRRTPVLSYFQRLGTTAFMLDKTIGKGKFDSRSKKCIFIGYSTQSKAYRLWDPESRKILRSRDVTFTGLCQEQKNFTEFIDENVWRKDPEIYVQVDSNSREEERKKEERRTRGRKRRTQRYQRKFHRRILLSRKRNSKNLEKRTRKDKVGENRKNGKTEENIQRSSRETKYRSRKPDRRRRKPEPRRTFRETRGTF